MKKAAIVSPATTPLTNIGNINNSAKEANRKYIVKEDRKSRYGTR